MTAPESGVADRPGAWAAPDPARPVRVLFLGGQGRSGTTLLDRVLGQLPQFFSAGELIHLWAHGLRGERCGCGRPFTECPFWSAVGEQAFGGWDTVPADDVYILQRRVDRSRYIPGMLAPRLLPGYQRRLEDYVERLGLLYSAISEASGSRIIVDSSKHPSVAYLLRRVPGVDVRVVQVVRSSHGVSYSWTKVVEKPEVVGRLEHMPRYRPARSALWWTGYNALFQGLGAFGVPMITVQYERFVSHPREEIERILDLTDQRVDEAQLAYIEPDAVTLSPTHTVSGNPMRFKNGRITLRLDEEWQQRMRRRDRLLVSACSWPMLRHYGYRLDGSVARHR